MSELCARLDRSYQVLVHCISPFIFVIADLCETTLFVWPRRAERWERDMGFVLFFFRSFLDLAEIWRSSFRKF